ncbi:hypothetical protein TREMEDRAFT_66002 [Tremella mesenterica DSM 1558]|uniref:uncharacterized protein n=1 Tax=Tremella mesenterica (strain ATCC 24925 / CBS 8224 / DSM 1558 / NBRC 9311 / NRRL Y-6157 / RJB 2259-6 / UBC 559-6) TaxID=578456 RepID=UPI00032D071A|nr:uncharacterized protein TREMEDRAFT_66002 [Tremella mesenterica DSM 1558]EIW65916.1 hypothetical protein TREMEDRAFT_66002 [Tremella mesenterica DSM 1558]
MSLTLAGPSRQTFLYIKSIPSKKTSKVISTTQRYASGPNPHLTPLDAKQDALRSLLYPPEASSSSSPVGSYHPSLLPRLKHVIGDPEVHETIERAYKLHQRLQRETQTRSLQLKYRAMVEACEELLRMSEEGEVEKNVYDRAMTKSGQSEKVEGEIKRGNPEVKWAAARLEGLFPREMGVPVESRGKSWDYGWRRPGSD